MPSEQDFIRSFVEHAPEELKRLLRELPIADPTIDEPILIACGTASLGIQGAKQETCSYCPTKIWLSPSTQELLRERGDRPTELVCPVCMAKAMKKAKQIDAFVIEPPK